VTGLTNGTQYSFRVSAYNGTEWSEPSTTATATPRGEADLLGPQVPETPLPLGQGNALIDGKPAEISVEPNSEVSPSGLIMTGDGFSMSLAGVNRANQPLGLTPEGALILESDRFASVEGTGFKPLSEVQLYAFSEPRFLGSITTDANGGFNGKVQIPLDLPAGQHTLQANGLSPNDEVRSLSIGVLVREAKTRQLARNVYFAGGSSKITAVAAKNLRALVASKKSAISQVRVTGFVQATTSTANDRALSAARARAVKVFLKKLGVKAQFTLKAAGAASASSTDRRSRVTITLDVT
jgi:outer membrane protein OmpA-like peptidoglycan-associated protein